MAEADQELDKNSEIFSWCDDCQFLPIVSHEFKNILTIFIGLTESLINSDLTDELNDEFAQTLLKKARRLSQMADAVMDIAKMKQADMRASFAGRTRLDLLLDSVIDLFRGQIGNPITKNIPDSLPFIPADEDLLRLAFVNLIENAAKYSPAKSPIMISATHARKSIVVAIRNTGQLISDDSGEHGFEPFFRGDNANGKPGHGLGLFITKKIIDLHKGEIWFEPSSDFRTVVFIKIPAYSVK